MERSEFKIEICANSVQSCIEAQKGGADRVELCAGIPEGGTTPSAGMIRCARESITIGLNVIIRPRGGDFLYSDNEVQQMLYDIRTAVDLGADGLVFGCLTPEGNVDLRTMEKLMKAAGNVPVTFHRAFDFAREPLVAMEDIIALGCRRILTSGCKPTAELGAGVIAKIVAAAGDRILIMPGCGIRENNIAYIARETGAHEFHTSARERLASGMIFRNPDVILGPDAADEFAIDQTTAAKVHATIAALIAG